MRLIWIGCVIFLFCTNLSANEHSKMSKRNSHFVKKSSTQKQHCRRNASSLRYKKGFFGFQGSAGSTGATGATGAQGPAGTFSTSYASSADTVAAIQFLSVGVNTIRFSTDQVSPVNIIHPVSADYSQFQLQNPGTYLVEWDVTFTDVTNVGSAPTSVMLELYNLSDHTPVFPGENETIVNTSSAYTTVSGHAIVSLTAANTILQLLLNVSTDAASIAVAHRTFSIIQIGP